MILREPGHTDYDLKFNFFGFPCRVHPAFFILSIFFGQHTISYASEIGLNAGVALLVVILVLFLSIFVHELGHALAFRRFGQPSRIVLYWMGGLAIPEGRSNRRMTPNERMFVSFAGPALGMLFGALLCGIVYLLGGTIGFSWPSFTGDYKNAFPSVYPKFDHDYVTANPAIHTFFSSSLFINLFWNLINLLPVYPLDGGQIAREMLEKKDYQGTGTLTSQKLSCVTGGVLAFLGLITSDFFIAALFGYLAYQSYQDIQGRYGKSAW